MKKLERNDMKQLKGGVRTADGGSCAIVCSNGDSYVIANTPPSSRGTYGYWTGNTYHRLCP